MSATHLSISVHKSKSTSANQQHHTERFDNKHKHTNESIDPSKSEQNINLRPDLQGSYNQRFDKIMDEHYTGRRKKDGTPWLASGKNASIRLLQISVNIGEVDNEGKPITKMTDAELVKLYKDDIYPMLENEYGRENIVGAAIHLDESKPHLHIDVVPLTEDGRLSAKEIVGGKGKMHHKQSEWLKQMQDKRPDLNFVRKKDGVNGLELDKLKELTAQAKAEAKKVTNKEWERINKADDKLSAKAKDIGDWFQEKAKFSATLNKLGDSLLEREDELDKREIVLDEQEGKLNERKSDLDEREKTLNSEVRRQVENRTRGRMHTLDVRKTELDGRESALEEKLSAFGKMKERMVNVLKSLPKMQNTLLEYIKHAKEERERKEREEKAAQIASYADKETDNVVSALEIENFERADQHVENLKKVKDVTDEIDESQFELPADAIDVSQFYIPDKRQRTL